ncbi:MAG: phosphodiesterase YaeI [Planctomycetota bacterium]|jgi:predicted MPP superfamily phosphohydrolase
MTITRRRLLKLGAAGAAACVGTGVYAFGIEPIWLRRVDLEVRLDGLDAAFDGFTIVQLSDFHVGAGVPYDYLRDAVALARAARPDLVALTGDFVHGGGDAGLADDAAEIVSTLPPAAPTCAVLGNHDGGVYGPERTADPVSFRRVHDTLAAAGIRVLLNERLTLERGRARLHVAGLGDLWVGAFRPRAVPLRDRGGPTVALSHNPDTAYDVAAHGADLILSGHTHGGQVSLPFLGPPILPVRHRELAAGHYHLKGAQLYVNRGVGWLRRVRLFVRPEVTVLRLRPAT